MGTILNKLWTSKNTTLIILWVIVFAWVYNLDHFKKSVIHPAPPVGKTLEEIMAGPVNTPSEPPWDTDFKSAIEDVK